MVESKSVREYRALARQCQDNAQESLRSIDRVRWITLAAKWLALADSVEREELSEAA
jgi:hypothetical protein